MRQGPELAGPCLPEVLVKIASKNKRLPFLAVFTALFCFLIHTTGLFYATGCGSSTGAPPVVIPAPTGGHITVTAPDNDGKSLVFGKIIVEETALPNVDVIVTNESTLGSEQTTADDQAFFSVEIDASLNDVIKVQYRDSTTNRLSEETSITVGNGTQTMPTEGMVLQDVDVDSANGIAYNVANDGTDSEIIGIDLTTGAIDSRVGYDNVTYDKIAVHSGLGYAAILDSSASRLYWCDLNGTGSCTTENIVATPNDVAVIDLAETPITTEDLIIIAHQYETTFNSLLTIYEINAADPPTLGAESTRCITSPSGADPYPTINCNAGTDPQPTAATHVSLISDSNVPRMAMIVEYADGSLATHFAHLQDAGAFTDLTTGTMVGTDLTNTVDPYDLVWHSSEVALISDMTDGNLISLEETAGVGGTTIATDTLSVGSEPRGIYSDATNKRAFIAVQDTDLVLNIDMDDFALSDKSYNANFDPTEIVYYTDGASEYIGVILTDPESLFQTIDISD